MKTNLNWIRTSAGVEMPPLIYGTAWKKERTADLVVKAVQTGFRGIDTAGQPKHYNEKGVGEAFLTLNQQGINRENLYLQTKFTPLSGQDPDQVPYDKKAPVEIQVAQSFASSLKNLKTDYVDSLVLHSPIAPYEKLIAVWHAMEAIYHSGGARQLGISNSYQPELIAALYTDVHVKPAVLQNRFYQESSYDAELRKWCRDTGVIYQSFWTLTANPQLLADETIQTLARKTGKTPAQILFRYLNQSGVVPLTGTTSAQHMTEDLAIFEFELTAEDLKSIDRLLVPVK